MTRLSPDEIRKLDCLRRDISTLILAMQRSLEGYGYDLDAEEIQYVHRRFDRVSAMAMDSVRHKSRVPK